MRQGRTTIRWTAFGAALLMAGCTTPQKSIDAKIKRPDGEITQASDATLPGSPVQHEGLIAAENTYKREEFKKAGGMFEDIADDTKNRPEVAERARFYQAECLRRQGQLSQGRRYVPQTAARFPGRTLSRTSRRSDVLDRQRVVEVPYATKSPT